MTPYYQDDYCQIFHGNCLEIFPQLPKVDLVLTDPPYGTLDGRGKVQKRSNKLGAFNVGEWDRALPLRWVEMASRLLNDGCWCVSFTDKLSVKDVWDEFETHGIRPKQTFYWIKTNPPPQPRSNFASGIETAVCGTKGAVKKWNGGGWSLNWFQCPLVTSNRTTHTTQKPLALMSHLIGLTCDFGDVVLDPFMGSGTTLRAAKDLNRKSIGIEIEEKYCEIAARRLQQEVLDFGQVAL